MKMVVFFAAALVAQAEPAREVGVTNAWMSNGIHLKITASVGGPGPADYGFGFRTTSRNSVYREFIDKNRVVFGYEIEVRRLKEKDRVQVVLKPLSDEYVRLGGSRRVPTFPAVRELPEMWLGDKATIDVLENPSTKQKVTDTIEVDDSPGVIVSESDNSSGIGLSNTRVTINGKPAGASSSGVHGDGLVMFYIPGKGSYFLSLQPVPGYNFMKIGTVDGKRLSFVLNNEKHEVISDSNITESGEIWVMHDARKPTAEWLKGNGDKFFQAAAGSLRSFYKD